VETIPHDITSTPLARALGKRGSSEYMGPFKLYLDTVDEVKVPKVKAYKETTEGEPPVTTVDWPYHNYVLKSNYNFEVISEDIPALTSYVASSTYLVINIIGESSSAYEFVLLTENFSTQTDVPFGSVIIGTAHTDENSLFTSVDQLHFGNIYIKTTNTFPCKITGKSGAFYTVEKYENGIDAATTGVGSVYVLMLNFADTLPNGTWIVASESQMGITGGGNVP
jgi:hypothetical protein